MPQNFNSKNIYEVLGVDSDATTKQIKRKFRKLALRYHPDKIVAKSDDERRRFEDIFKNIRAAYDVLIDEQKRSKFDRLLNANSASHYASNLATNEYASASSMNPIDSFFSSMGDMNHCDEKSESEFKKYYFTDANNNLKDFLRAERGAPINPNQGTDHTSRCNRTTYTHRAANSDEIQRLIRSMRPDKGPRMGIASPDAPCTSGCTMFNSMRTTVPMSARPRMGQPADIGEVRLESLPSERLPPTKYNANSNGFGRKSVPPKKMHVIHENSTRTFSNKSTSSKQTEPKETTAMSHSDRSRMHTFIPEEVRAVILEGLTKTPQHNGVVATVLGRQSTTGRFRVKLPGSNQVFAIKPKNGRPVPVSTLINLRSRSNMNGTYVAVCGFSTDNTRRYQCKLLNPSEYDGTSKMKRGQKTFLVHAKNLRLEPGTRVKSIYSSDSRGNKKQRPKGAAVSNWGDSRIEIVRFMIETGQYIVRSDCVVVPVRSFRIYRPDPQKQKESLPRPVATSTFMVSPADIAVDFSYYV